MTEATLPVVDALAAARLGVFAELASQRRATWIEAVGPSMVPLIEPGDELFVAFGAVPTARGQVVVTTSGRRLVAHRLVAWDRRAGRRRLRTKGDAEPFADPPVADAAVLGVVLAVRTGPTSEERRRGLHGGVAAGIALLSWATDRASRVIRRVTNRLPEPVGGPVLHAILWIVSIPLQVALVFARRGPEPSPREEVRTG